MLQTVNEFNRPLGQTLPAQRAASPRLAGRPVLAGLATLAIVGVAGAIALTRTTYLTAPPPLPVVEAAKTVPAPAAAPSETRASAATAAPLPVPGAKIIRVQPADGGVGAGSGGGIVVRDASTVGQDARVSYMPDRALLETGPEGPLPVRSVDGRRPFDAYRTPWSGARGARIAIVVGGLAISQTGTQEAIAKLPAEVTLAFSPQGNSIQRWMQASRQAGHEVWMQVPLEPFDYPRVDSGRNTLTVAASPDENLQKLRWALSRTTNFVGVLNFMGARFTADSAAMEPMLAELGRRGLGYLDDGSSARSTAPDLAAKNKVPFAGADATIDASRERGAILKKLDELEATARAKSTAIGTASAFTETVDTVTDWAREARKRGIEIVPVSAIAADPGP